MQRARVLRVSCIALGLPRTTLTRVALVVVVILVVTLQMHYKHTHTDRERESVWGKWRHAHAHSDTYWQYLRIFAAWPKSPRGRRMLGMQGARGDGVGWGAWPGCEFATFIVFKTLFNFFFFFLCLLAKLPFSLSFSYSISLSLSLSSGVAVVVIAAIEVLFYAQFVCCGT